MKRLEAHELALSEIFGGKFDFRIPNYQRPYAWEVEHATQLLIDLVGFLEMKGEEPYFLGSIVLIKSDDGTGAEVIDGQQRLTTLTILLAVLRDLTRTSDLRKDLDAMVTNPGSMALSQAAKPRLTLRSKDAKFFATRVQVKDSIPGLLELNPDALKTDSQRAILANARAFHASLAPWDESQLLELVQLLCQRTFLVVVSTPDLDSAHRIFSVMNARGLNLSPADIFKSYLIGDLGEDSAAANACAADWEDAEEALGRDDFADLFLHIRMVFAKERAKQVLLREFPAQVLNQYRPHRSAEFVTDVLVPYAAAYEQIRNQSYSAKHGAEKVNTWFRRLAQLDNNDWRPTALWALSKHAAEPGYLDEFLRALERLAASMFIRRVYTTPRVLRYAELLRQLDNDGTGMDSPAFELSDTERTETIAHIDGPIYLDTKTRKYVLLRLNEALAPSAGLTFDFPLITVEHVLPQNPKFSGVWMDDFADTDRAYWTHRLANLVLLNRAKNSEAQNYEFAVKKAKYFTGKNGVAPFPITIQVVGQDSWTPPLLEARQRELVTQLQELWRL